LEGVGKRIFSVGISFPMASQEAGRRGSFPPHPQDVAILAAAAGVFPSAKAVGNSTPL
jgi:hypothetical protein